MEPKSPAGASGAAGSAGTPETPGTPGTPATAESLGTLAGHVLHEEVQVSPELRARILRQIDQVMAEGRRPVPEAELPIKPRKKGILYPILINVVAAALVILGFLGLAYVFRGEQTAGSLASAGFQSAEGRLLEALRRQSESRLQEEQAQTQEAQEKLRVTESGLEQRLQEREEALHRSMDAELKAERERLAAQGLAVAEVERRLRALEAERQAALAAEVGQLRAGLRLQELADARSEERLVDDRIRAALGQTLRKLRDEDLGGARDNLAALKMLLGEPAMQENPGLRERLPVDLLVAEALGELLELRGRPAAVAGGPAVAAAASATPEAPAVPGPDPALKARLQAAEAGQDSLRAELERAQAESTERDRQASRLASQLAAANARVEASAQTARAAEEKAGKQGREEAFKQVIAFLDYMKADPARKQQLTAQLAARARQDPLYATVAREIQILAAGAGMGGSASPFKLLGTVSSLSSGRVVVEPLVDLAVKAGARVQIRRASGLASEVLVARGIVQQAGAGGVTVLLDAAGKTVPEVMDVVYVEAGD